MGGMSHQRRFSNNPHESCSWPATAERLGLFFLPGLRLTANLKGFREQPHTDRS